MARCDLDVAALGEQVKSLYGDEFFQFVLQRGLAMAIRNTLASATYTKDACPESGGGVEAVQKALTTEAVVSALRTEFLRLIRPH